MHFFAEIRGGPLNFTNLRVSTLRSAAPAASGRVKLRGRRNPGGELCGIDGNTGSLLSVA